MKIKTLKNIPVDIITPCFNASFANYFVPFNDVSKDYLQERWAAAQVDYSLSVGAFDKDQLVGFIIHGIDHRMGRLSAFNAATGVIPSHRGQRLVKKMYKFILPKLKKKGVKHYSLEVITKNKIAIQAYKSVGMKKTRTLHCFSGEIDLPKIKIKGLEINRVKKADWGDYQNFWDYYPAWENSVACVQAHKKKYKIYEMEYKGDLVGYGIINPKTGAVPQFAIHPERYQLGLGFALFHHLQKKSSKLRINNVDKRSAITIQFLNQIGLTNTINQYEMEMTI